MLLLDMMLWMKWREYRPHPHAPHCTDKYKHISSLQHFSPNSGFQLSSDWIHPL